MALMLTIVRDTWLKVSQAQSANLADDQKHFVAVGKQFLLSDCKRENNHIKVTLSPDAAQQFSGRSVWYVYFPDVEVWQDGTKLKAGDKRPDTNAPPHGSGGGVRNLPGVHNLPAALVRDARDEVGDTDTP